MKIDWSVVEELGEQMEFPHLAGAWSFTPAILPTKESPYYWLVPKDPDENIAYRRAMIRACAGDRAMQEREWLRCKRDKLYWICVYCWTYAPKLFERHPVRPWITWPCQDRVILEIDRRRGMGMIPLAKSRDVGATWMGIADHCHTFIFESMQALGLASRKEGLVEKKDNPGSLFAKWDFLMNRLPSWMRPKIDSYLLHRGNLDNGSMEDGESSTGNMFRGDRRGKIMIDELGAFGEADGIDAMGAVSDATATCLLPSTPQGASGAFYEMCHGGADPIYLTWAEHPYKSDGLYTHDGKGHLLHLDSAHVLPPDYPYRFDSYGSGRPRLRSPWYDAKEDELKISSLMRQEHDVDFLGSGTPVFNPAEMAQMREKYGRRPIHRGMLKLTDGQAANFVEGDAGNWSLWCELGVAGRPPLGDYMMGVDISAGVEASNTCLAVYDRNTQELVAHFISSSISPGDELAHLAAGAARWFHDATVIWECNGSVGAQFTQAITQLGYERLFYEQRASKERKPGWVSNEDKRAAMLEQFAIAVRTGHCLVRSVDVYSEFREFKWKNRQIIHSRVARLGGQIGQRKGHGDIVTACALGWIPLAVSGGMLKPLPSRSYDLTNTMAGRHKLRERRALVATGAPGDW